MTEEQFWGRPFEPAAVKVDVHRDAARAKLVRDALLTISRDLEAAGHQYRATAFDCAAAAQDDVLAKLGRLLR